MPTEREPGVLGVASGVDLRGGGWGLLRPTATATKPLKGL